MFYLAEKLTQFFLKTSPTKKSTTDYFTPNNQPLTEFSVIKELLRRSEEVTEELGQAYVLNRTLSTLVAA